jgi:hypothetical protein
MRVFSLPELAVAAGEVVHLVRRVWPRRPSEVRKKMLTISIWQEPLRLAPPSKVGNGTTIRVFGFSTGPSSGYGWSPHVSFRGWEDLESAGMDHVMWAGEFFYHLAESRESLLIHQRCVRNTADRQGPRRSCK